MATTLKDIAQRLNVSIATVSRVVNGKRGVDSRMRARVLEALKQSNYRPNGVARGLKLRKTSAIGLIVPDITNPFFSNLIKGLEAVTWQHEFALLLCNSDEDPQRESENLSLLLSQNVAGLVLITVQVAPAHIGEYFAADVPVVFVDNLPALDVDFDYVVVDNVDSSFELIRHVISLGHRRIGIIAGPASETSGAGTFEGWRKALDEHGVEIREEWIGRGDFKFASGYEQMKLLLAAPELPTAVFAANNQMAYGAYQALVEQRLRVPEDLSLVAFDVADATGLMHPVLTAMLEPAEEIGRMAGEILFRKLQNPDIRTCEHITLEATLRAGDSCIRMG